MTPTAADIPMHKQRDNSSARNSEYASAATHSLTTTINKTNVLLLTSSLERGGAERQVVELAKSLDSERFNVHVASLSHNNPLAEQLGDLQARFHIVEKRSKYDVGLIRRVRDLLIKLDIHVVHSFMFDAEMVGRLAGRWAGTPAVICSNRCPHWNRKKHKLWLARATNGCFDAMIANSQAGCDFEREQQNVPVDKLHVIPNGVDIERFHPGRPDDLRAELDLPRDALIVGMIAHFRSNKDHPTYIKAAAKVVARHPNAIFICAGDQDGSGPEHHFGKAQRLATSLGIAERLHFLGPRGDVDRLYRMLDIKVLATHFEGTPNVVLEAMATGLPTVVTDVSDNRRVVQDGKTGLLVRSQDAEMLADTLCALIESPALREEIGKAARERAEVEYSTQTLGERTANVYCDVLRRKGAPNLASGQWPGAI